MQSRYTEQNQNSHVYQDRAAEMKIHLDTHDDMQMKIYE